MTLEDIINEYETMKKIVDFVYVNGIFPDENKDDGIYVLVFQHKGPLESYCYFTYSFDIDDDGWIDDVSFGGDDLDFSVIRIKHIYNFIMALSNFHQENKNNENNILKFINYLKKEREKNDV